MKANGRDYAWLAEQCYVTESTVRNWMARKPIPKSKEFIIRQMIAQSAVALPNAALSGDAPISVKSETLITFKLGQDIRKKLEDRAFKLGLTMEEFLTQEMGKLAADS